MNLTFDWLLSRLAGIHNENQGNQAKTELYAFYGYVKFN